MTFVVAPIAFGSVQFRISEVFAILPFFFPVAVPGLFIGCLIANWLFSPYGLVDVVVGSAASLVAALCTMQIGKISRERLSAKVFACLPPVIVNAVFIGALIAWFAVGFDDAGVFLSAFTSFGLWVGLGQMVVLYGLGLPLLIFLPKFGVIDKLSEVYGHES